MSIELVEPGDIHLDYSDVYTNKHSRISPTENAHKRSIRPHVLENSPFSYGQIQETTLKIRANRFYSNPLLFSVSNQTSLFDFYSFVKAQCYKDAYHIQPPMFRVRKTPVDFIPPQPKNQLSCIIHQLAVVNKNEDILIIPPDPTITMETFMKSNIGYFNRSYGRYAIYILDEYAMQMHGHQKTSPVLQTMLSEIKLAFQKYLACKFQR